MTVLKLLWCYIILIDVLTNSYSAAKEVKGENIEEVHVYEKSSFVRFMHKDVSIIRCWAEFQNVIFPLEVKDAPITTTTTHWSQDNMLTVAEQKIDRKTRVVSLRRGICGFHLKRVEKSDNGTWSLMALYNDGASSNDTFYVIVYDPIPANVLQKTIKTTIGDSLKMQCGDEIDRPYDKCLIYDQNWILRAVSDDCAYFVDKVTVADLGRWYCMAEMREKTMMLRYSVIVKSRVPYLSVETHKNHLYTTIKCRLMEAPCCMHRCIITPPKGGPFNIVPGSATAKYHSAGTNFSQGLCLLTIPSDLEEHEIGRWSCEINLHGERYGGFIDITEKTKDEHQIITEETRANEIKSVEVAIGNPFTVKCQSDFYVSYCHIMNPKLDAFTPNVANKGYLGECALSVEESLYWHNGIWNCTYPQPTPQPNKWINVQVTVIKPEKELPEVTDKVLDAVIIKCSVPLLPIRSCRIIAPNGTSYYVADGDATAFFSYSGEGYEHGVCGASIRTEQLKVNGKWACLMETDYNGFFMTTVWITVPGNVGVGTGISIGVGVVAFAIISVLVIRKWRQKGHVATSTIENDTNETNETRF